MTTESTDNPSRTFGYIIWTKKCMSKQEKKIAFTAKSYNQENEN